MYFQDNCPKKKSRNPKAFCSYVDEMTALGTNLEITMETQALVSSPILLKPNRQKDASLHDKLRKGSSVSTAATEDLSCDGSSTCRSKSSSSGSFATPGKKKSALKMTALCNKSAQFSLEIEATIPLHEDGKDDFAQDDSPWWNNSPVKQGKRNKGGELSFRVDEPNRILPSPELSTGGCDSPESHADAFSDKEAWGESKQDQEQSQPESADSKTLVAKGGSSVQSPEKGSHIVKVQRSAEPENGDDKEETESPSKRKEKKKRTVKRITVAKVKASDLANQFLNANGEAISDPKELQDAIRLWKAERRSSLTGASDAGSPRKESARGRKSSLGAASSKTDSPRKQRSKSKARSAVSEEADNPMQPRGRSVSKVRRKTIEFREKSRAAVEAETSAPSATSNTPLVTEDVKVGRSRSVVRKATAEGGNEHARSVSQARKSTQSGRKTRGRSVAKKAESDGEKKRSSSLAHGLAKLYNESNDIAGVVGRGSASALQKCDATFVTTQSDDVMVERRRTHSLARGIKRNPKDTHRREERRSNPLDDTKSVSSEDNVAIRRRSKSVGVGLRGESVAVAQSAPARRMVARTNSSNAAKRRSASTSRRRSEDDLTKSANLSVQSDDDFFNQQ